MPPSSDNYFGEHEQVPPSDDMEVEEATPTRVHDLETGLWFTPREYHFFTKLIVHIFEHTKVFEPLLFIKTGMDSNFHSIFNAIGWNTFWDVSHDLGSKTLTLEFLSTLQASNDGVYFSMFNHDYNFTWESFSVALGFAHTL